MFKQIPHRLLQSLLILHQLSKFLIQIQNFDNIPYIPFILRVFIDMVLIDFISEPLIIIVMTAANYFSHLRGQLIPFLILLHPLFIDRLFLSFHLVDLFRMLFHSISCFFESKFLWDCLFPEETIYLVFQFWHLIWMTKCLLSTHLLRKNRESLVLHYFWMSDYN